VGFLLALIPAAAVSRFLGDALGATMAADVLLEGLDTTVLGEIGQYNRTAVSPLVVASLMTTLLVAPWWGRSPPAARSRCWCPATIAR